MNIPRPHHKDLWKRPIRNEWALTDAARISVKFVRGKFVIKYGIFLKGRKS